MLCAVAALDRGGSCRRGRHDPQAQRRLPHITVTRVLALELDVTDEGSSRRCRCGCRRALRSASMPWSTMQATCPWAWCEEFTEQQARTQFEVNFFSAHCGSVKR